jgi:hypothetical protein
MLFENHFWLFKVQFYDGKCSMVFWSWLRIILFNVDIFFNGVETKCVANDVAIGVQTQKTNNS